MKPYYGSKFPYYRMFDMWERTRWDWAFTLKVGDYIGACTGHNHQIAKFNDYEYRRVGVRSKYILSISIIDTHGGYHNLSCDGGGCVQEKETLEQIIAYNLSFLEGYKDDPDFTSEYYQKMLFDLKNGNRVFTPEGDLTQEYYELRDRKRT